jgi:5,10-methylenetetrahydromethanopterin reductase
MGEPATGRTVEMWMAGANIGGRARELARGAEAQGFDGISFGDTECQNPDAFIGLALAAGVTSRLRLAVGVTNPVIRHPAALACAMATVQLESGGRAVLGIGRGDSAVSKVGLRASTVGGLETFLERLQTYLAGEVVEEDGPLAQLTWTAPLSVPKVPVDVAASGPGVIAAGARLAERVTFNVGADPDRVHSCIDLARATRRAAGLPPQGISLGAYLNVAPHPDAATARELVKPVVAVYARFSKRAGGLAEGDASVIQAVADHYDMSRHGRGGAAHLAYLTDDFVDRFAVAGTPEHCVDRLTELTAMGIERFAIVGPTGDADPDVVGQARRLLSEVVLPGVRANVGQNPGAASS